MLEPKFEIISEFQEGVAFFKDCKGFSFINKEMKRITKSYFEDVQGFCEGMAAIKINGKWGFINKKGEIVIKPAFHDVGRFSEGLATFSPFPQFPLYGFIDITGKEIIKPLFEGSGFFENGVCKITVVKGSIGVPNYIWCYIDREGKIIWEPSFQACRISEKDLEEILKEIRSSN